VIAVLLDSSHGLVAYGPFDDDDRLTAQRFADFLTATVDPAAVTLAGPLAGNPFVTWSSALGELLGWYEHTKGAAS
jgi:hypothetical protein